MNNTDLIAAIALDPLKTNYTQVHAILVNQDLLYTYGAVVGAIGFAAGVITVLLVVWIRVWVRVHRGH
jgi:hypothetical protein